MMMFSEGRAVVGRAVSIIQADIGDGFLFIQFKIDCALIPFSVV
jgi:hypothetical protein